MISSNPCSDSSSGMGRKKPGISTRQNDSLDQAGYTDMIDPVKGLREDALAPSIHPRDFEHVHGGRTPLIVDSFHGQRGLGKVGDLLPMCLP
jgi:hypothetical protein